MDYPWYGRIQRTGVFHRKFVYIHILLPRLSTEKRGMRAKSEAYRTRKKLHGLKCALKGENAGEEAYTPALSRARVL